MAHSTKTAVVVLAALAAWWLLASAVDARDILHSQGNVDCRGKGHLFYPRCNCRGTEDQVNCLIEGCTKGNMNMCNAGRALAEQYSPVAIGVGDAMAWMGTRAAMGGK